MRRGQRRRLYDRSRIPVYSHEGFEADDIIGTLAREVSEKGTAVVLTIFREGDNDPKEIKIVRDTINIPTLDTELRPDGIFVIKLYSFSANSSPVKNTSAPIRPKKTNSNMKKNFKNIRFI